MTLNYGHSVIDIDVPAAVEWHVLQKDVPFSFASQADIVQNGVNELVRQLKYRIEPRAQVLLVVPDHTRKCNLPLILPPLVERLENIFLADAQILFSNGSHAQQPEAAVKELISPDIYDRIPTKQHDALKDEYTAFFGKTSFGTPVILNKLVQEADFIITIGGVLYHYFAGFGGGAKMLLPGVAAYETIRQNHSLTITADGRFHPHAQNGNTTTNPVFLDLSQVVRFVPNALSLQVVLSSQGKIVCCKAGPILETQKKLFPLVEKLYSCKLPKRAEIVIASAGGFPSDINLIQAHKSIHHAFQAVTRGGTLIIFAECRQGIGSETFLPYFEYGSAQEIGAALRRNYEINGQTALTLKEKAEQCTIYLISSLQPDIVKKTGMIPCACLNDALADIPHLEEKKGIILPHAHVTLPLVVP